MTRLLGSFDPISVEAFVPSSFCHTLSIALAGASPCEAVGRAFRAKRRAGRLKTAASPPALGFQIRAHVLLSFHGALRHPILKDNREAIQSRLPVLQRSRPFFSHSLQPQ